MNERRKEERDIYFLNVTRSLHQPTPLYNEAVSDLVSLFCNYFDPSGLTLHHSYVYISTTTIANNTTTTTTTTTTITNNNNNNNNNNNTVTTATVTLQSFPTHPVRHYGYSI